MKWTIKLVVEVFPGSPVEHEVSSIERTEEVSPATVGPTIADGKALLASLQSQVVTEHGRRYVASVKACPQCGNALRTKGYHRSTLRSVYGKVGTRIRRLENALALDRMRQVSRRCSRTKNPITPELRYLTAKMAALLPFRNVTEFLGELLPLSAQATASTVRTER